MVEKGSDLGNLTDKKREAPLYESFCVILCVCAGFHVSLRLSASLCVSVRVSLRRLSAYSCAFARLAALSFRVSPCLSASLCVVFPRLPRYSRVSLCLSASLCIVFPLPSATSLRVSKCICTSFCIFPRACASPSRISLHVSASVCVGRLPASLLGFHDLCVVFLSLSTSFHVSPRRLSASL